MSQGELCPAGQYFEGHSHEHFGGKVRVHAVMGRRDHIAFFIGKTVRTDDSFRFCNLPENTGTSIVLTLGRPHAVEIGSANPEIDFT
jgi:hypothetical protein